MKQNEENEENEENENEFEISLLSNSEIELFICAPFITTGHVLIITVLKQAVQVLLPTLHSH